MPDDLSSLLIDPPAHQTEQPGFDVTCRLNPGEGLVLYYPGARSDYGPLQHFALNLNLAVAVYVDYLIRPEIIREMLHRISATVPELRPLSPSDLGYQTWADFWPEHPKSLMYAQPSSAFGVFCDLKIHPGRSTRLIYLATEGHQTYGRLLGTALQPDLVVLQDHGFGGGWRDFGGESPMYRMAKEANALPSLLFSPGEHTNTKVWPGYTPMTRPLLLPGQAHDYARSLYRLTSGVDASERDTRGRFRLWF